jgi:asparagine synthase (glutamine-hydrolysing)
MSGVLAWLRLDGAPADPTILDRMIACLERRGPHGTRVRQMTHATLASACLDTSGSTAGVDMQPFAHAGATCLVADARLDARDDLVAAVRADASASDAELILRAYGRWGEDCVEHLAGDFMFALWDGPRRQLFCGRDQLGLKPLFYAERGNGVVVSNSLECVRLHPAVSAELHEPAIADFLLFGANQDGAATSFRDVGRLPAAHSITWRPGGSRLRRYWTMPIEEPLQLRRAGEYPERLRALLSDAVRDRLRTRRVAVLMSGGVDSPALAATSLRVLREEPSPFCVQAITSVYDRLVPDRERYHAGLVANHLGIPIEYDVRDDEVSITEWDRLTVQTPEPVANPAAFAAALTFFSSAAATARVFLYGEGPDNALRYEWQPFLSHLLARRRIITLLRAVASDLWMHRRVPLLASLANVATPAPTPEQERFPEWLDGDFARRCGCRERWERRGSRASPHPTRPSAYASFEDPLWQSLFEGCELYGAASHTDIRHPYLDLRVLRFLLAVPVMPWCREKAILRQALSRELPAQILRRRKTPAAGSPDFERVKSSGLPRPAVPLELRNYVNPDKIPRAPHTALELRSALRPLGLSYWLQGARGDRTGGRNERREFAEGRAASPRT